MILILGDVHGEWGELNTVVLKALRTYSGISAIVQVGDLGYSWPGHKPFAFSSAFGTKKEVKHAESLPFHWLEGNHEHYTKLLLDNGASQPGLIYQPRGSTHDFGGTLGTAMFFGGASSIDREQRIPFKEWWPEECITLHQVLPVLHADNKCKVDILFSHDHPSSIPHSDKLYGSNQFGRSDRIALELVREKVKPRFCVFGHHHKFGSGKLKDGTIWACVPIIDSRHAILYDGKHLQLISP